jgi:hypothetical protein
MSEVNDNKLDSPEEVPSNPKIEIPSIAEIRHSRYNKALIFATAGIFSWAGYLTYNGIVGPDKPATTANLPKISGKILKGIGTQTLKISTVPGKNLIIDVECPGVCAVFVDVQGNRAVEITDQYGLGKAPSVSIPRPLEGSLSGEVISGQQETWVLGVTNGSAQLDK